MKRMNINEIRRRNARLLLKRVGGSITAFADKIDRRQSLVSAYIGNVSKQKNIGDDMARHIERCFGKPEDWLDHIHETKFTVRESNIAYLPSRKAHPELDKNTEIGPDITGQVPLISWVTAGQWTEVIDSFNPSEAEDWFDCPVKHGPKTYVLRIKGASMEPRFHEGWLIFVDPDREPANGDFVVVRLEDSSEATFKKLRIEGGEMWLEALNPAWPERFIRLDPDAIICGVVIFHGEVL